MTWQVWDQASLRQGSPLLSPDAQHTRARWKTSFQESVFVSQPMFLFFFSRRKKPRSRTRRAVDARALFTPSNFISLPSSVCFHHGLYIRNIDSQPHSISIAFPRPCSQLSPLIISNMKALHWPLCSQTHSSTLWWTCWTFTLLTSVKFTCDERIHNGWVNLSDTHAQGRFQYNLLQPQRWETWNTSPGSSGI